LPTTADVEDNNAEDAATRGEGRRQHRQCIPIDCHYCRRYRRCRRRRCYRNNADDTNTRN
jgi:hypothetical protein